MFIGVTDSTSKGGPFLDVQTNLRDRRAPFAASKMIEQTMNQEEQVSRRRAGGRRDGRGAAFPVLAQKLIQGRQRRVP